MEQRLLVFGGGCLLCIALLIAGGMLTYSMLSRSDFFQVSEIEITGNLHVTQKQILDFAGIDVQTNLLAMKVGVMKEKLEAHGWIEQVRIKRDWPNRVILSVRERTPVALVSLEDGLYFLDRKCVCFARALPPENIDFPVISGHGLEGLGVNENQEQQVDEVLWEALRFIRLTGWGSVALPRQNVSEVHLGEDGNLTLFLVDRPFPIYLGKGEIKKKYYRLTRILTWLYRKKKFQSVMSIRVDYQEDKILAELLEDG